MLLINFLGLIAKLASVCDGCDVGTHEVKNFDWNKVCTVVLRQFLIQAAFKTSDFLCLIFGSINSYSVEYIRIYVRAIE
jgi:hypothetical protein